MGTLFEPLILYFVLFFSGSIGLQNTQEIFSFSVPGSLLQIFLFSIPSLLLIWHLLLKDSGSFKKEYFLPRMSDFSSLVITLPGLILIGFTIALVSSFFSGYSQNPVFLPIKGFFSWSVLALSCISTGYLEESFFRFYLLSKLNEMGIKEIKAILFSTFLFSICHIYEGPWGFLNSVLSSILLAYIFLRYRSIHGIALAHGLYNFFVFAMSQ